MTPAFTVSNKIPTTTSPASFRKQILSGKTLYGVNLTDGATAPIDPVGTAKLLASYGINLARLHHLDVGLIKGWWTVEQILSFADALYSQGIRFSIDGCSKLGELYPGGLDTFRHDLYDGKESAMGLYKANIERIAPLLRHKGCFLACLVNEGAHTTTADKAQAFWNQWAPVFRNINPNLLLSDCPDGPTVPDDQKLAFQEVAKSYDVILCHYYNSDGYGEGQGNNIYDGWSWWAVLNMSKLGKPILIQEFGSYKSNPYQGSNIAFVLMEAKRRNFSTCQFSFASQSDLSGDGKYTMVEDPFRLNLLLMGAYVYKNAKAPFMASWPADTWGNWGTTYSFQTGNVQMTQDYVRFGPYFMPFDKRYPAGIWKSI